MSATQLSASEVKAAWGPAAQRGVSVVARSSRGFARAYLGGGGRVSAEWATKRRNFISRHRAQARLTHEPMWTSKGEPTRRHLALMMWAYTPTPVRTRRWLQTLRGSR